MQNFKGETEKVLDLLFPKKCASCGCALNYGNKSSDSLLASFICKECEGSIVRVKPDYTKGLISRHAFDDFAAPFYYEGAVREALLKLKFGSNINSAPFLGRELEREIRTKFYGVKFDILTCVPSTKRSLSERGYNQACVIADNIELPVPRDYHLLVKNKSTGIQHLLDAESRRKNIESAYQMSEGRNVVGKTILLIDDIMTTGATCDACARTLKLSGASSVYVACSALTRFKEDTIICERSIDCSLI